MRNVLEPTKLSPEVATELGAFHAAVIDEVKTAVAREPVVVVGMAQNPHVKNVRKALDAAGVKFTYLEYGSYFSEWRRRLAIKLWTGYPTFPQVFVKGTLIGGENRTVAELNDGTLQKRLAS